MGKTLLLADDSVTIQKVVGISFASEEIAIVTVDNGDDAIAKARELRPDVILADVVMPGKSGYEVCQAVKADAALQHIPVLLLTGTFEAFDEERAQQVGAAGHVSKPFEAQTLVEQVKDLLARAPVAPPVAPAVPPAPPAAVAGSDDSFDFFEDSADDFADRPMPAAPASAEPTAELIPDSLDVGAADAFSFGDDDLGAPIEPLDELSPLPSANRDGPDATVALIPEPAADPAATVVDTSFRMGSDADAAGAAPASYLEPDALDFADANESTATGLDTRDIAGAAVLDPYMGNDLAVSSSDLQDTGPFQAPPPAAMGIGGEDPVMGILAGDSAPPTELLSPLEEAAAAEPLLSAEPLRAPPESPPIDVGLGTATAATPPPAPAAADVASEATAFVPISPEPPLAPARPEPLPIPTDDVGSVQVAIESPARSDGPVEMSQDAVNHLVEQVAPALREELHQTLERIAWESFSAITEQLVAQAVERIERVAWEAVPKLAETLIQEEIRKLKGHT